jgi:cytochrome d ubiquinol oxidase subunit II
VQTVWYGLVAVMLAVYVVLDGFDFGAGILHLYVARNDDERRTVLAAIGPVWDGNEVWLLAAGGTLVFDFPRAYAAGFSGFYLPLMMALWLLVMRGISIEFRSQHANPLWRSFWDGLFALSSTLMAVILGAALGCVVRGVPIDRTGYFNGPLFTHFRPYGNTGVLDWYTVLVGVFATLVLAVHAALYLVWKTSGPVQLRSHACARVLGPIVIVVGVLTTIATARVRPDLYPALMSRHWTWALVALIAAGLLGLLYADRTGRELVAFASSSLAIAALLAATAAGHYPNILISTVSPKFNVTASSAASGEHGLLLGLIWWTFAFLLTAGYFAYLYHQFRGKVTLQPDGHGY